MIYVAFVSHDDELEIVPLGMVRTAKEAVQLCRNHATENEDGVEVWDWETADHTRIKGEFWQVEVRTRINEVFHYYVRPFDIELLLK